MKFIDHPIILLIVAICSIPLYATLAKAFWGEKFESLSEAIRYLFWPDIYWLFKGKYWQDLEATESIYLYVALCVGWACAVTEIIVRHTM